LAGASVAKPARRLVPLTEVTPGPVLITATPPATGATGTTWAQIATRRWGAVPELVDGSSDPPPSLGVAGDSRRGSLTRPRARYFFPSRLARSSVASPCTTSHCAAAVAARIALASEISMGSFTKPMPTPPSSWTQGSGFGSPESKRGVAPDAGSRDASVRFGSCSACGTERFFADSGVFAVGFDSRRPKSVASGWMGEIRGPPASPIPRRRSQQCHQTFSSVPLTRI
jgi:hypothetical protein